jgi:hypothetical protein
MQNTLKQRSEQLSLFLNERQRRLFAATEALAYRRDGIEFVERELGISHKVIQAGIRELKNPEQIDPDRIRKPGGGGSVPLIRTRRCSATSKMAVSNGNQRANRRRYASMTFKFQNWGKSIRTASYDLTANAGWVSVGNGSRHVGFCG